MQLDLLINKLQTNYLSSMIISQEITGVYMRNCMLHYTQHRNMYPTWALGEYREHVLLSQKPDVQAGIVSAWFYRMRAMCMCVFSCLKQNKTPVELYVDKGRVEYPCNMIRRVWVYLHVIFIVVVVFFKWI